MQKDIPENDGLCIAGFLLLLFNLLPDLQQLVQKRFAVQVAFQQIVIYPEPDGALNIVKTLVAGQEQDMGALVNFPDECREINTVQSVLPSRRFP